MSVCITLFWDSHKPLPHHPPHRRVLGAESGLLLSLDPTQHLFNAYFYPHVVHLKACNRVSWGLLHMPPTLLFGLSFLPVRSKRSECLLLTVEQKLACPYDRVAVASSNSLVPSQFHHFRFPSFLSKFPPPFWRKLHLLSCVLRSMR